MITPKAPVFHVRTMHDDYLLLIRIYKNIELFSEVVL